MENSVSHDIPAARSRILVLGATGGTGRPIVRQALARGHDVTALVRSPEKARDLAGLPGHPEPPGDRQGELTIPPQ